MTEAGWLSCWDPTAKMNSSTQLGNLVSMLSLLDNGFKWLWNELLDGTKVNGDGYQRSSQHAAISGSFLAFPFWVSGLGAWWMQAVEGVAEIQNQQCGRTTKQSQRLRDASHSRYWGDERRRAWMATEMPINCREIAVIFILLAVRAAHVAIPIHPRPSFMTPSHTKRKNAL
jgi:hypothetical protein